jgi:hypothetical protein
MRILAWKLLANVVADFCWLPSNCYNPTQQDPHGPEDDIISEPSIILIWTYQGMMEWMSRILVGEMAGADEDFGLWKLDKCGLFLLASQLLIQLSKIHIGQMILSEPSIILIWTYQDMMEWMSRMLVGEMAGAG